MADVPDGFEPLPFPEDMNCCICLEPMLRAVTLDPCKHKVCQGCEAGLAARRQCPHCRHALTGAALDHTFSNLVHDAYHRMRCSGCLQEVTDAARHQCAVAALMQKFADQLGSLSDATARALIARELANPAGTPAEQEARVRDCLAREAAYLDEQLRSLAAAAAAAVPAAAAADSSGLAPEQQRRRGKVVFAGTDKKKEAFAKVSDAETNQLHFLHSRNVLDGAILQPGLEVSYVLAPNPMRPGEEIATQARAEGEGARRLGVVKVWHNNKKFGFITETAGERRDLWFGIQDWQGTAPPRAEMEVEFTAGVSAKVENRPVALKVTPLKPEAPAPPPKPPAKGKGEAPGSQPKSPVSSSSSTSTAPNTPPPPGAGVGKVYVLWDFDDLQGWGRARTLQAYQAILGRLLSEGVIASKAEPTTLAFGALTAFGEASVAQALNDLSVEVKAHSGLKKEQTNRNLEREAEALAGRADTRTVVIVSSDTDFVALTRRLVNQGKRALVLHSAPAGSEQEQMLSTFVPAYFLPELAPSPEPQGSPGGQDAPVSGGEVRRGKVVWVAVDKNKKQFGSIEDTESKTSHYFHSSHVAGGVPLEVDQLVSFGLAPDPKDPKKLMAIDVNVMPGDGPLRRGFVKVWMPEKQHGFIGEVGEKDVHFYASEWKGAAAPEVGQAVEFVSVPNPKFPDRRAGKQVTPLGPAAAAASSRVSPPPPLPRPAGVAAGPPPSATTPRSSPGAEVRRGTVTRVAMDKRGKQYGFIVDSETAASHYCHSSNVAEGLQLQAGLEVSFKLVDDPKNPTGRVAVQVAAWQGDSPLRQADGTVRQGVVKSWKPAKQTGFVVVPGETPVFFAVRDWTGGAAPREGQPVQFVVTHFPPGLPFAQHVTPLGPVPTPLPPPPLPPHPVGPPETSPAAPPPKPQPKPKSKPKGPAKVAPPPASPITGGGGPAPATPTAGATAGGAAVEAPPGVAPAPPPPTPPPPPPAEPAAGLRRGTVLTCAGGLRTGSLQPAGGGPSIPFSFDDVKSSRPIVPGLEVFYTTISNPGLTGGLQAKSIIPIPKPSSVPSAAPPASPASPASPAPTPAPAPAPAPAPSPARAPVPTSPPPPSRPAPAPPSHGQAALEAATASYMARYADTVPLAPPMLRALIQRTLALPGLDENERASRIDMDVSLEWSRLYR